MLLKIELEAKSLSLWRPATKLQTCFLPLLFGFPSILEFLDLVLVSDLKIFGVGLLIDINFQIGNRI